MTLTAPQPLLRHPRYRPHRSVDVHVVGRFGVAPNRGLFPFSVFPTAVSHIHPASTHAHPVTLRPQGFAPSRRFAPTTVCRAYSIPIPLMGFPFEALIRRRRRTFSRTPNPSGLTSRSSVLRSREKASLRMSRPTVRGCARRPQPLVGPEFSSGDPPAVPPWASASEVSTPCDLARLPPIRVAPSRLANRLPLSRFFARAFTLARPLAPQGLSCLTACSLSLERSLPP
jgi:hypothetical protein